MFIYSIKNESTGFFNRPLFCESSEEVKNFIQNNIASDPTRGLFQLAEVLSLYFVGEIDFTTMKINQPKKPIKEFDLVDVIKDIKFKEVIYKDVDVSQN